MTTANTMTPAQTLHLLEDFVDSMKTRKALEALIHMSQRLITWNEVEEFWAEHPELEKPDFNMISAGLAYEYHKYAGRAEAYFCGSEMSDLVLHSAKVLDRSDVADASIVPSDYGFCYFENGIEIGDNVIIHALVWSKSDKYLNGQPSWTVYAFNDYMKKPDIVSLSRRNLWDKRYPGEPYESAYGRWTLSMASAYVNGSIVTIESDSGYSSEEKAELIERNVVAVDMSHLSLLHSLFLLMQQTRVVDSSRRETSPNKKKIARLKKKEISQDVTVVRLRKTEYVNSQPKTSGIEYSVRWFVSAHWRWQPYKREDGVSDYKRILISPYIKGPDDKPLKISKKVFAVVK